MVGSFNRSAFLLGGGNQISGGVGDHFSRGGLVAVRYLMHIVEDSALPAACGWIAQRVGDAWYIFVKASRCPVDVREFLHNVAMTLSGGISALAPARVPIALPAPA